MVQVGKFFAHPMLTAQTGPPVDHGVAGSGALCMHIVHLSTWRKSCLDKVGKFALQGLSIMPSVRWHISIGVGRFQGRTQTATARGKGEVQHYQACLAVRSCWVATAVPQLAESELHPANRLGSQSGHANLRSSVPVDGSCTSGIATVDRTRGQYGSR